MMSCALCFKWQHILCHNKRDQAVGHPVRNWDSVEFICQRCRVNQLDGSDAHTKLATMQQAPQHLDTPQLAASHTIPETLQRSGSFVHGSQEGSLLGSYSRRPNGTGQSSGARGYFLSSTSNAYDPRPVSSPRQMISFSHYQPAEHGFSSSVQNAYKPDSAYPIYENQHLELNGVAPYKPQVSM